MAPVPTSLESADPEDLGRREFTKARKGWDILEVRAHVLAMASEIKRLRGLESDLGARVRTLETSLRDQADLDESKLTQMVGEETARVLEAARTAATEIRQKAEDAAARLVREAQERAGELTKEATETRDRSVRDADELAERARTTSDELVAAAKVEAVLLRETAESETRELREAATEILAARTTEAEAAATAIRVEAEAVLEQAKTDADEAREAAEVFAVNRKALAESDAESIVTAARDQSRDMLAETKVARERMLADLSERRHAARQQLESLRAARERMLESFAAAREAFDRSDDHLVEALPHARQAAEDAAAAVVLDLDAAALIGELGLSDPILDEPEGADTPDSAGAVGDAPGAPMREGASSADQVTSAIEPRAVENDGVPSDEPSEIDEEDPADAGAEGDEGSHLRLVSSGPGLAAVDDLDDDDHDDDDHDSINDASVDPDSGAADAIFARLRADVAPVQDSSSDAPAMLEVATLGSASADADSSAKASATTIEVDTPAEESSTAVIIDLVAPSGLLDDRDAALGTTERTLGRRLKRAISDHENVVLDRIRRHRKGPLELSLLGEADDLVLAVAVAALDDVTEAVSAGSTFLDDDGHGGAVQSAEIAEELTASLGSTTVEPLLGRLGDAISAHDTGSGSDDLIAVCRSIYREAKGDSIVAIAGDLVTTAFNRGILESAQPGVRHCWLVDNGGLPCPDAEDNSLSDPVVAGEEFPTGHVSPAAHPGCRCLLAPPPH